MSEYQRYEFMACDQPLTRAQLDEVNALSSHIEASSTHALIEYNWGDFKHNPLKVLYRFFDGFLYWANWGAPQLALRFPHGVLPAKLLEGYDFDDMVTFTTRADYDILNIEFGELEGPDEWPDYELSDLIAIRDELMEGDLRSLYIAWLASQAMFEDHHHRRTYYGANEGDWEDDEEEDDDWEDDEEEDSDSDEPERDAHPIPPVPPMFGKLTAAQFALAQLLQVPPTLLQATARHSSSQATPQAKDHFAEWLQLLSPERKDEYLLRLARNEPGLSRLLIAELRELNPAKTSSVEVSGERIAYTILRAEGKTAKAQAEREKREREAAARLQRLQEIHAHKETFWRQVELAAGRKTSTGYNDALQGLIDLRDAARQFNEMPNFQERFLQWVEPHLRRPALIRRLQEHNFTFS